MKTALARALVHDPANIVLDEPTNGLDVLATRALRESLRWLRTPAGGGKCIVFSTHIMQEVERLCDSVVVVAEGRTVASGTVAELLERRPASATSRRPSSASPSRRAGHGGGARMKRSFAAVAHGAPQGAHRRAARPAHAGDGAGVLGAARAAGAARRLRRWSPRWSRAPSCARSTSPASAHAPTLQNFLERQTYTVKAPPADYEAQLRKSKFTDPVVVVPDDFETALARGDAPVVEIVSDSANQRSEAATARIERLLDAFSRERAVLNLALRGVAVQVLEPMRVDERDLANQQTRATRITGMMPYFVMMAVLYGALTAALDTTAGERERGSLEPLLMNPAERWALVVGKWGAVACVSMLIAVLSSLELPARPVDAAQRHPGGDVPVRAARGAAVPGGAAAVRGGAVGGADGGGDPLQDLQGGAGELDHRHPR